MSNEDGSISYQSRSKQDVPLELLNIVEKRRFMDGEKVRAAKSRSFGLGISFSSYQINFVCVKHS